MMVSEKSKAPNFYGDTARLFQLLQISAHCIVMNGIGRDLRVEMIGDVHIQSTDGITRKFITSCGKRVAVNHFNSTTDRIVTGPNVERIFLIESVAIFEDRSLKNNGFFKQIYNDIHCCGSKKLYRSRLPIIIYWSLNFTK